MQTKMLINGDAGLLINTGFTIVSTDYRAISGEIFLWVTAKPD